MLDQLDLVSCECDYFECVFVCARPVLFTTARAVIAVRNKSEKISGSRKSFDPIKRQIRREMAEEN